MAVSVNIEKNFRDFSLKVQFEGSSAAIGILGASGSGKSMTLRCIAGIETPDRGKIIINGKTVFDSEAGINLKPQKRRIGYLFQNYALFPWLKVGENIEYPMKKMKVPKEERKKKLKELLEMAQLTKYENYYIHEISGGMRQRVMIAMAIINHPDLIIADEPTTALDVTIQSQILELFRNIQKKFRTATILVSHDLSVVAGVADRVAVMYAGKIVEIGTTEEIFYQPKHPYTWALLQSLPALSKGKAELFTIPGMPPNLAHPPKGDAFACRNPYAVARDYEEEPPMFKISDTHYAATWLEHPDAPKIGIPEPLKSRIAAQLAREVNP